ncbi:MAG: hypothetical protein LUC83_11380 [Clostridiales bacterium]|nr:hypothetical protein [Clostridiales bacterium]
MMRNIVETWHLEAKQEDDSLFYCLDEVESIKNGKKCYVIGRKGMGKTAIAEYLYNQREANVFSERLSFKNFPFNLLYSLDDDTYTSPNQYITIWKYLIYNAICKMMAKNESLESELLNVLRSMYPQEPIRTLKKLVPKWTADGFGVDILGCGANISGVSKKTETMDWKTKADLFEDIIEEYIDDSYYYILIDELDEDFRDFETEGQRKVYVYLLTSLFKAVQDIRAYFKDCDINIRPVVFLRSDIYAFIKDSDKNKWSEYRLDLTWTPEKLYNMICHRLSVSSRGKWSDEEVWSELFRHKYVYMGNRGHNKMKTFDYITRSTHWRPRDYIHYILQCSQRALDKGDTCILSPVVKEADKEFSEYLKGEIVDETFAVLPNIDQTLSVLSQIRKQTFAPAEFLQAYSAACSAGEDESKLILLQLFEHGIIGNQPSMKGQQIFKYQYPNALFNFNENIIIIGGYTRLYRYFK